MLLKRGLVFSVTLPRNVFNPLIPGLVWLTLQYKSTHSLFGLISVYHLKSFLNMDSFYVIIYKNDMFLTLIFQDLFSTSW